MAMSCPHVTVAMITFNHEKYIAASVSSILSQTFENFELLIVDDGSSDATGEIIGEFKDPRIRYLFQPNQGPSVARNTALQLARGRLLAQMSGDDLAEPTRLAEQVAWHQRQPNSVIFSRCTFIDDSGSFIEYPRREANFNHENWPREKTLRHLFLTANCFLAPSALAATAHFRSLGPYKPQLLQTQDYDMWVRFLVNGFDAYIVQKPLVRYRVRGDGGNIDSASTQGLESRAFFEMRFILREFFQIRDAECLAAALPEVEHLGYPVQDDLCGFLLALITLLPEFRTSGLAFHGAQFLMEMMADPVQAELLREKANFHYRDLFSLLGDVQILPGAWMLARNQQLEAQMQRLHRSTSWRLTGPLRWLMGRLRRGRSLAMAAWLRSGGSRA